MFKFNQIVCLVSGILLCWMAHSEANNPTSLPPDIDLSAGQGMAQMPDVMQMSGHSNSKQQGPARAQANTSESSSGTKRKGGPGRMHQGGAAEEEGTTRSRLGLRCCFMTRTYLIL